MSKTLATNEALLRQILLEDGQAIDPAVTGFTAPIGSLLDQHGVYPTTPTNLHLKSGAGDHDWLKQNLTGIRTYNIKDPVYGAIGDGVADDTAAINLAITACNAAGGGVVYIPPGSYKVTKNVVPPSLAAEYVSFFLSDAHNITFLGDGEASKIVFADNTAGVFWDGFYVTNGSTNISWRDLSMDGSAMVTTPANNAMVQVVALAANPLVGMTNFSMQGCTIGPCSGVGYFVNTTDLAHLITNVRAHENTIDGSVSGGANGAGVGGAALTWSTFFNHAICSHNYALGGPGELTSASVRITSNGVALGSSVWDWHVNGNHFSRPATDTTVANLLVADGAEMNHNTFTSVAGGVTCSANSLNNRSVRGNVAVLSGATNGGLTAGQHGANGQSTVARGNVVARLGYTGTPSGTLTVNNLAHTGSTVGFLNNIAEGGTTASNLLITTNGPTGAGAVVANGNIAVSHDTLVNAGVGISTNIGANAGPSAVSVVGNLVIVAEGNPVLNAVTSSAGAGNNTRLTDISANLFAGTIRGVSVINGIRSEWISARVNNHLPANAAGDVNPPGGNAGYTAGGNAGGSPQIMASLATMIGNVMASKGSLGCNTAGTQGTTLFYKQTDDATPAGGTAGWMGIAGYELTFGVLAGSTTATALFYGGGMGLAAPIATEIQYAMPRPGALRNLRLRTVAGTGSGTCTFSVRKNGVATGIGFTINNTATTGTDTTNSVAVVRGDLVSFQVTKTGTITTAQTLVRAVMELAS